MVVAPCRTARDHTRAGRPVLGDDRAPADQPVVLRRPALLVGRDRLHVDDDLLEGIASLFNGALFKASTIDAVGVPDLRLFVRGDEVEVHRRLQRSGLKFGTCLTAAYVHPNGAEEFKPILGGRMHTQYP